MTSSQCYMISAFPSTLPATKVILHMPITFTSAFPFLYLWLRFLCGINFPVGWGREHGYASYSSLLSWTLNKGKHCINAPFNIQCRLIIYYHREGEPFIDQDRSSHTHDIIHSTSFLFLLRRDGSHLCLQVRPIVCHCLSLFGHLSFVFKESNLQGRQSDQF